MSKELYRKKIADKRQDIISLRARIDKLKQDKKKRMDYFTRNIKSTSSVSSKENYRKNKVKESEKYTPFSKVSIFILVLVLFVVHFCPSIDVRIVA